MASESRSNPRQPVDIDDLIVRYLEGHASVEDVSTLTELLHGSRAVRQRFVTLSLHDRCLAEIATAERAPSSITPRPATAIPTSRLGLSPLAITGIAAALLLAVTLAVYLLVFSGTGTDRGGPSIAGPAFATLIESTDTVLVDDQIAQEGQQYPASRVAIDAGNAEFLLSNGTRVRLMGPTAVTVSSSMAAAIERGRVEFVCPHNVVGYTVHLPNRTRIVDLGTRFSVRVDPMRQWIEVLDGAVSIERHGRESVRLDAGMALAIGPGGDEPYAAGVVAEWSFDGEPGQPADTLTSEADYSELALHASGSGAGAAPAYDREVPALSDANDGIAARSLRFVYAGRVDQPSRDGGVLIAHDPDALLRLDAFTVEGYVRIDRHVDFAQIIGVDRAGGVSWSLDTGSRGTLRARIDHHAAGVTAGQGVSGFNVGIDSEGQLEDGRWHHFAATWDGETHTFTLYVDHQRVASRSIGTDLVYDGGPLRLGNGGGGRALDGWLDHVRITRRVLEPSDMLPLPQLTKEPVSPETPRLTTPPLEGEPS